MGFDKTLIEKLHLEESDFEGFDSFKETNLLFLPFVIIFYVLMPITGLYVNLEDENGKVAFLFLSGIFILMYLVFI